MAKVAKFPRSETEAVIKLADKLADDQKFADAVAAHKPGEEAKLKATLLEYGFNASEVTIQAKKVGICFCLPGICVCVEIKE